MIILKSLKLNSFLSHTNTELEFDENSKILLDGKSGSGKTSIVEGLTWAFYGEARCQNKDLIRRGEKSCSIDLTLLDNTNNIFYKITRSVTDKSKNSLTVSESIDGENFIVIERNGIKDTQDFIEKSLLHCSYQLFTNSVVYLQNNIDSFVNQTASKRKDLLLEIANVADFDLYYNRARDLLSLKNEEKIRLNTQIESIENSIVSLGVLSIDENKITADLDLLSIQKNSLKEDLISVGIEKRGITSAQESIDKLSKQCAEKLVENETLNRNIKTKEDTISKVKAIDIKDINERLILVSFGSEQKAVLEQKRDKDYERTNKLNALMADRPHDRDYDSEITEINKRLIPLIKDSGKCPSGDNCPFIIPIQNQITYLGEQINEKIGKKAELEKAKAIYSQKIVDLGVPLFTKEDSEEFVNLLKLESERLDLLTQKASVEAQIATLPALESEVSEMKNKVLKNKGEIETISLEIGQKTASIDQGFLNSLTLKENKISTQIYDIELVEKSLHSQLTLWKNSITQIERMTKEVTEIKEVLFKLDITISSIMLIKEAFGSKGLKTVVIDYLIPRLEEKVNEILSKLSDFQVRLDTQKSGSDGESIVEGLFINIFNERGEQFEFSNYSGGERLKITVAISEALASLQRCGFRIFDELFIGLDEDSTEHFGYVMEELQSKFKQVLCISHLRTIKDLFDNKVEIIKVNGNSKINNNESEITEETTKEKKTRKPRVSKVQKPDATKTNKTK